METRISKSTHCQVLEGEKEVPNYLWYQWISNDAYPTYHFSALVTGQETQQFRAKELKNIENNSWDTNLKLENTYCHTIKYKYWIDVGVGQSNNLTNAQYQQK